MNQLSTLWSRDTAWHGPALLNLLLSCIAPTSSNFAATAMQDLHSIVVQAAKSWTAPSTTAKPRQQHNFLVQHISCLRLFAWTNFSFEGVDGSPAFARDMQLGDSLWRGLQTANISNLIVGEFFSEDFITKLPYIHTPYLPRISGIAGLQCLQSLTLHLNLWGVYNLFSSGSGNNGNVGCLQVLHQLTSLTLMANEVVPDRRKRGKYSIPADRLLHSLPYSIQSVSLCNFRQRWKVFHGLSCRPKLVNLDLTSSACIFPPAKAWSQLQQLKLTDSLVWLEPNQPFQFSLLTQLSMLDLNRCAFRRMDRPHNYAPQHIQAPGSIALLSMLTKSVKSFTVTEPLTALTSLALLKTCELKDTDAFLLQMPNLRVTLDTLSKVYHGEWWSQLRALHTKLPRRCGLGVAGLYPTALEVLQLHTESPEPVLVTTDKVAGQSKAYPHLVAPSPAMGGQGRQPQQQGARIAAHRGTQLGRRARRLDPMVALPKKQLIDEKVLQNLRVLELHFTGGLMQLVLTGLPKLQHLTVNQQAPRVEPRQHECCTAFRLPNSLCSFDLTRSTGHLCIHALGALQSLPALTDVGLHGAALTSITDLGTTVTRLDLGNSQLVSTESYPRLWEMTHLQELVLPHPLPLDDTRAQELQTHLKQHHVQLHYSSTAPSVPGKCGTCLHPMPQPVNSTPAEDPHGVYFELNDISSDDDDELDEAMQMALMADAAFNAF